MTRKIRYNRRKIGSIPGTLVYTGDKIADPVKISHIEYNGEMFQEQVISNLQSYKINKKADTVSWININGIYDLEIINKLKEKFCIHPLVMEDILNVSQRPKYEDFEDYIFVVLKMFQYEETTDDVQSEQMSILLYKGTVLTFQEHEGDVFNQIRDRIRNKKGRICNKKGDYLVYSLLDAIVNYYFVILEKLGERLERIEEEVFSNPKKETVAKIHYLKQEIILLRKSIWPIRDVVNSLIKGESSLIEKESRPFLHDLYDHTIEIMDIIESYRDTNTSLMDMYLSSISNRMNEIMKVLTMMSTIFIPLSFLAGLYGMNFKNMPELEMPFAYPVVLSLMIAIVIGMLLFFRRKKWL